ncbi:MAG: hypothetical protein A2145_01210 [candidate division Zixibacteria bacterium RBG_16_40_9]|nr:MAG: hypothetical protein A2145_01210 [candidate division Zixibacteria bacterium RBG_16_40_9]
MKILDRYLIRQFLQVLLFGLVSLTIIFLLVNLIEQMDYFIDRHAKLLHVIEYYFFYVPEVLALVIPVAMLLSTLFSLGVLSKHHEITAFKSSGTSLYRILAPIYLVALIISMAVILFNGYLVPYANQKKAEIKKTKFEKISSAEQVQLIDLFVQGDQGWIFHFKIYDPQLKQGTDGLFQRFEGEKLVEWLEAQKVIWKNPGWLLENGRVRVFEDTLLQPEKYQTFSSWVRYDLKAKPTLFSREQKTPDQMNLKELSSYIKLKKKSRKDVTKEVVDLYVLISLSMLNFIIVFFGAPLAANPRRAGLAFNFGVTVIVGFIYYILFKIGQSFGYNQKLSPWLSAWGGNIIFGILGLGILFKARK